MRSAVGGVVVGGSQRLVSRTENFLQTIGQEYGSAAEQAAGTALTQLEQDNAHSASYQSGTVTNHELRHDLEAQITEMAGSPNGFNASNASNAISSIEQQTGISHALMETHAETQIVKDFAKYGAFDTSSSSASLHTLISETTGANTESQLVSQVEAQMGSTAAKQLEENVVTQVSQDAASLHVNTDAPTRQELREYAEGIVTGDPNVTASNLQADLVRAAELQDGVGQAQIVAQLRHAN